jgi:phosphatidylglycerophosphate synthase
VTGEDANFDRVMILADESANWKIAGLNQLERLVLALNEFAESTGRESKIGIVIFWKPEIWVEKLWLPQNPKLTRCKLVADFEISSPDLSRRERILSTRLLVKRRGLARFLRNGPVVQRDSSIVDESEYWRKSWEHFENACRNEGASVSSQLWRYIAEGREIAQCERWLLRDAGKADDGMVARYLNRPISRAITRILLKTSITPNTWSVGITIVPLVACFFLFCGTYWGFVFAMSLFQIHSMLDGCDGEIARAKYLESESGRRLDASCDLGVTLLLAPSLGVGLYRQETANGVRLFYLIEGLWAFFFIAFQWWLSNRRQASFGHLSRHALDFLQSSSPAATSPQTQGKLRASVFARAKTFLVEITKRDVAHFTFLILAVAGLSNWILHILFTYALAGLALTLVGLSSSELPEKP